MIFLIAVLATTVMTLWSQLVGALFQQRYNEAQLLGLLFRDSWKEFAGLMGWVIHYALGYLMALWLVCMYNHTSLPATWFTGLWLGLIAGVLGATGWHVLYRIKEVPENVYLLGFYAQLLIGHALFGITCYVILISINNL